MMNENKKEALKIFLEYILQENENNTEINNIIEKHINEKLKDYFDVISTKIDEIDNKTNQLKKDFQEEITIKLDENKNVETKPKDGINDISSLEVKPTPDTPTKSKRNKKKITEQILLGYIPLMTEKECSNYFEKIKDKCKNMGSREVGSVLENEATPTSIAKKLRASKISVINKLNNLEEMDDIKFIKVAPHKTSPKVYVRIIREGINENIYEFKNKFNNPNYVLINGESVKPKKGNGKPLHLKAKQLLDLQKMIQGKDFTVELHDDVIRRIKDYGIVNGHTAEAYCYRLYHGFFDTVIDDFIIYEKKNINPTFELNGDSLKVNNEYEVSLDSVKNILQGIPFGSSKDVEVYARKCIDNYTNYPSEVIRILINNYDNISLTRFLKDENFVMDNVQKRKENGLL